MTSLRITIPGDPVPYTRARHGAHGNVYTPSKYRAWKDGAALLIKSAARGKKFYDVKVRVRMHLFTQTWRGDFDNFYKAALDSIVKSTIVLDDNRSCIGPPLECTDNVDKTNPRLELEIVAQEKI